MRTLRALFLIGQIIMSMQILAGQTVSSPSIWMTDKASISISGDTITVYDSLYDNVTGRYNGYTETYLIRDGHFDKLGASYVTISTVVELMERGRLKSFYQDSLLSGEFGYELLDSTSLPRTPGDYFTDKYQNLGNGKAYITSHNESAQLFFNWFAEGQHSRVLVANELLGEFVGGFFTIPDSSRIFLFKSGFTGPYMGITLWLFEKPE